MREILAHYPIPMSVVLGLFGALIGSFLNVVIARLPEGRSIVSPPSHCPKCGYRIPPWLNIPVLSWLMLRGRCRNCGASISIRYPIVELLTALLFIAVGQRFGLTPAMFASLLLVSGLIAITFIDIDYFEIPDEISIWGTGIGILARPWAFDVPWWSGLVGAVLGASFLMIVRLSYQIARKQEGMGLGDVKLLAMIGAFLGPGSLLPVILVASSLGSIYGIAVLVKARLGGEQEGPAADADPTPGDPDQNDERGAGAPRPAAASEGPASTTPPAPDETARAPDFVDEDGEAWIPPPHALPFGPFLALGALTVLLLQPVLEPWLAIFRG